jgi:hypothetical protein
MSPNGRDTNSLQVNSLTNFNELEKSTKSINIPANIELA